MPSSSLCSDIRPDRIQAREDQYRRNARARCQSPATKSSFDETELDAIGAHFDLFEDEPRPHSLEFTDNEAISSGSASTLGLIDTSTHSRNHPRSITTDGSPVSRACTPMKCDPYLPAHEFEELQRQISVSSKAAHVIYR
jgi:hypothetical protein